MAFGPFPADSFFQPEKYKAYDAVLAMYHDQGLTPFKTISYEEGVNYSAGLPFIRTSPITEPHMILQERISQTHNLLKKLFFRE